VAFLFEARFDLKELGGLLFGWDLLGHCAGDGQN
jgi:hypothetical protein